MSLLISRLLSKTHLQFEAPDRESSIALEEIALLINGEVSLEEVGSALRRLYDGLPSPKYFEKHLANAILLAPLQSSIAVQAVKEVVVFLCAQQNIPFFPSLIEENIYDCIKPVMLDSDEEELYSNAFRLARAHQDDFHQLLKILNFHPDDLSETLFSFLLSFQEKNPSGKLEASLFKLRGHCPFKEKVRLTQLFRAAQYRKKHDEECANDRWMEIQSFKGSSVVRDLFVNKNWGVVSNFTAHKIPEFLKLCLKLNLDQKYPAVFAEWVKNKSLIQYQSMMIEQLIHLKHFSSLAPLIELNKPQLLKKIEELIKACPFSDQEEFCWLALRNVPLGFAEPFLLDLIQKTDSVEKLAFIGEEFCKRIPSLYIPLLQKTLSVFDGSMRIQWSSWQISYLKSISPEELPQVFLILNHPKLSSETKHEMLEWVMPQVHKKDVPLWFELLDEDVEDSSLPENFREEKAKRSAQNIQDRIEQLTEPDDSLLKFSDHRGLLLNRVLLSESLALKLWLLEKGNLSNSEQRHLTINAYVFKPSDQTEQRLSMIIGSCKSTAEIDELLSHPHFDPSLKLYKCLCEVLRKLPPDPSISPRILNRLIDNAIDFFPWEHYSSQITLYPQSHSEVTSRLILVLKELPCVPIIFFELHDKMIKDYYFPETLIALFVFTNAFDTPNFLSLQVENLSILLEKHPESLSKIPLKDILGFVKKLMKPRMSKQSLIFFGKLLAALNETEEVKEWMRFYSKELIEFYFNHLPFANWARQQVESNEILWNSIALDSPIEKKQVSAQSVRSAPRSLSISFDPKDIEKRIFEERLRCLEQVPVQFRAQLKKSLNAVAYEGPQNSSGFKWLLSPTKNRAFICIFLEELAKWNPSIPCIAPFKNSFCRSLMREYCMSASDVDFEHILHLNFRCYASNSLPFVSLSYMETWGFTEIALLAATYGKFQGNTLKTLLQTINLISLGSCYEEPVYLSKPIIASSIEKISMELLDVDYLHPLLTLTSILKNHQKFLSESSYEALLKQCKDAKRKLLPTALKCIHQSPALFHGYPTLLFKSIKMLSAGLLPEEAKVNLYNYAFIAYRQLWINRSEMSDDDQREFLKSDMSHISTLVRCRGDIPLQKLDPLCVKWVEKMLQLCERCEDIEENEKKRISLSILSLFRNFDTYFLQHPDSFIDLWKMSRKLFSTVPAVDKLKLHNELTKGFANILALRKNDFQTLIQEECAQLDMPASELLKKHATEAFSLCGPWDHHNNPINQESFS